MEEDRIRRRVREGYAEIARTRNPCCGPNVSCSGREKTNLDVGKGIGYSEEELRLVPEGANLALGCGNPTALASLKEGETVVDLGSGAGLDCFIASKKVGASGRVIGVDMTPEMLDKARENAKSGSYGNVEFRLGEIEHLPIADGTADVVISNCVINLSPDKAKVFREAFRVLKPGGRLMVSDIVLLSELPPEIRNNIEAYVGCIAGAALKDEYISRIEEAGIRDVKIIEEKGFGDVYGELDVNELAEKLEAPVDLQQVARSVVSISVSGTKPR